MSQTASQASLFPKQREQQESVQLPIDNQQNHLVVVVVAAQGGNNDLFEPRPDNNHEMDTEALVAQAAHELPPGLQLRQ